MTSTSPHNSHPTVGRLAIWQQFSTNCHLLWNEASLRPSVAKQLANQKSTDQTTNPIVSHISRSVHALDVITDLVGQVRPDQASPGQQLSRRNVT